jgi:hypothetical protein
LEHRISSSWPSGGGFVKNRDFNECIYLLKTTDETISLVESAMKKINDEIKERTTANLIERINSELAGTQISNDDLQEKIRSFIDIERQNIRNKVFTANGQVIKNVLEELKYEAVLNQYQY